MPGMDVVLDSDVGRLRAGQGLVEYALIILLIALAVFAALFVLGTQLASTYTRITSSLQW